MTCIDVSQVRPELTVASPSKALRRSPRHTAPPLRMGLKEKVKASEEPRKATASAPSLVTRLPEVRKKPEAKARLSFASREVFRRAYEPHLDQG